MRKIIFSIPVVIFGVVGCMYFDGGIWLVLAVIFYLTSYITGFGDPQVNLKLFGNRYRLLGTAVVLVCIAVLDYYFHPNSVIPPALRFITTIVGGVVIYLSLYFISRWVLKRRNNAR